MDDTVSAIDDLTARGVITPDWVEAFRAVPRADYVPDRIWDLDNTLVDRTTDPDAWQRLVDADVPLVTHRADDGTPVSSSSMPYMVATMLRHLAPEPGDRALEIGTGTGWNAALLSHRLGDQNITTVDIDPDICADADAALKAAGYRPRVVCADGTDGMPDGTTVQRLIATCTVQTIPYAWVQQTRGVIVTPFGHGMSAGGLLRLESDGHTATGRIVDTSAFMWLRAQQPTAWTTGTTGDDTTTALDPRLLVADVHERFAVGLRVPGCRYSLAWGSGDEADECTLWLSDGASWASADSIPGRTRHDVTQAGPRRLWDEAETAYRWWEDQDRPEITRFGVTIDEHGQHHWLDRP
ncbi:methyltransferase domain-containing protein (plasmid) [Streptomycetaceae bacterium NBC_01309]